MQAESRRRFVAKIVSAGAAVLLGTAACGGDSNPDGATAPATVWEKITSGIAEDGTVGLDTALSAFSYAIAPVPGATVPDGEREVLPDGSAAVAWTLAHFDELSDEQRAAVAAALSVPEPTDGDGVGTSAAGNAPAARNTGAAGDTVPVGTLGRSVPRSAAERTIGCYGQRLATSDSPNAESYRQIVDGMISKIGAKLNRKLTMTTYVVVERRATAGDTSQAYSWIDPGPDCDANKGQVCQIHLNPKGAAATGAHLEGVLAHEVMHCYVFEILGVQAYHLPPWIGEGLPAWAGEAIAGGTGSSQRWWKSYLTTPGKSLFQRDYDAIGIYALAETNGVNIWQITSPLLSAFDSEPAWDLLVADRDAMLDMWGSSLLREPARGSGWDATGPGITADKATAVNRGKLGNGGTVSVAAPKVATALATVDLAADIVDITVDGHARISLSGGANEVVHGTATWCLLSGGCTCPDGQNRASGSAAPGPAVVAVTGGAKAGSVRIAGRKLDCQEKPPVQAAPDVDACVVGSWTSTDIRVHDKQTGAAQELPGGAGVVLTIDPSGAARLDQSEAAPLRSNVGGNVFATRLSGVGSGQVRAVGGKLTLADNDFDETLTWQIVTAMGPGRALPGTVALGTGQYTCSAAKLTLTFPYPLGEVKAIYER